MLLVRVVAKVLKISLGGLIDGQDWRFLIDTDLSPKVHPAIGGILFSFEPVRLGDATGRGAEPSTQRSVPSCCIADAVSLA